MTPYVTYTYYKIILNTNPRNYNRFTLDGHIIVPAKVVKEMDRQYVCLPTN